MNVYYHYKKTQLPDDNKFEAGDYLYIRTDSNNGEQFASENGEIKQLTVQTNVVSTYQFPYRYTSSSSDGAVYGIVDNRYVTLTRVAITDWKKTYVYTPTAVATTNSTATSSPTRSQYILYNGGLSTIYSVRSYIYFNSSDKKWYRTRTRNGRTYEYSDEITQACATQSAVIRL